MSLEICDIEDGDARAVFRNFNFDMRMYKRLRMFVHAEAAGQFENLNDGDLSIFVRLGSDYNGNYYEYEVPLKVLLGAHYFQKIFGPMTIMLIWFLRI